MRRSIERTLSAIIGGTLICGVAGAAIAQDGAPVLLGAPRPAAAAAQPAKPKTTPTAAVKPGTAAKPAAKPGAKPAAAAKPAKAAKPAGDPTAAAAAAAAKLAAMTGQAVPPKHDHVFEQPKQAACANPNAIGISRVMKVDTTGGYYVGTTYRKRLPLEPKEVVLTFDDGPMAGRTDRVLKALDDECTKATFFIVGQMAKAYPETLRKTAAAGHTIAYHTMTHPLGLNKWPLEKAQNDVRSGWQTVDQILYGQVADHPATPFFRYPGLFNSRPLNDWFNGMNMGVWTIDAAGNDWLRGYITMADGPNVMNEALKELEARQGGILLLHDIKDSSSSIVAPLLKELKARGFKIVHIQPKNPPPKLVGGPIKGVMPTVAETTGPVEQRALENFDATRQLAQVGEGRTGKTSTAPLPVYGAAKPVAAAAVVPAAATATLPATPAHPDEAETTASVPARHEEGWFSSTASSFKGLGGALGLW